MSINERNYMSADDRRHERLRRAMDKLEPGVHTRAAGEQLLLFPSKWDRFKLRVVAAIRSEWFNVFVFLLMVLTAVLWSATAASDAGERDLEQRIERLEDSVRILSKIHYDAALRATGMDALASPDLKARAVELACEDGCKTPAYLDWPAPRPPK